MFNEGTIKTIDNKTLQKWLASPDTYNKEITDILNYYYITDGAIFQLYDMMSNLSELNYSIKSFSIGKSQDKNIKKIDKIMEKKIKYKILTRDILTQLHSKGTLICTWLGTKEKPYLFIFDDLDYVFPAYRREGEMVANIDLSWFDEMQEDEREIYFSNLSSMKIREKYDAYKKDRQNNKHLELPIDKTIVLRTHTTNRNQRLGIPHGTQTLFDLQHKKKMKDLEVTIANKVMRAIALLKFKGKDDNDTRVVPKSKALVLKEVKRVLQLNQTDGGIACIGIPDFASFEFPEIKNSDKMLDSEKYKTVNRDISNGIGISTTLTTGLEGNFASAKLNLEMIYKKIGSSLEQIEEVYNKLIEWTLNGNDDYFLEFDKEMPLTKKEKIETLFKLHQEGFAIKPVVDLIDGVDYNDYIAQSIYEIEKLKLREKIIPPSLSYTSSGKEDSTSSTSDTDTSSDNQNTIVAKGNKRDSTPRAGV